MRNKSIVQSICISNWSIKNKHAVPLYNVTLLVTNVTKVAKCKIKMKINQTESIGVDLFKNYKILFSVA